MDTDFASFSDTHFKNVHDPHHVLKSRASHIFPALVEAMNSMFVKILRNVAKTYIGDDPISTIRVLSGLLQIQNCYDILLFELLVYVELLY